MLFTSLITALSLASPAIAAAIEKRNIDVVLVTCPNSPADTDALMAKAYTSLCINYAGCAHSVAPTLVDEEWIGDCLNCPNDDDKYRDGYFLDGCLLVRQ
ncbi:hypothetical protein ColLi_06637 [Colletotrichum liriopes]|uniref:Uncharacterized protein n=1 Tax=Colletotrichum liriopes TaxID=708192 RepID=A0AA37LT12_9PEZI|nr:hypothetical protein ColLi_06637 [Colletotrichum liriopes]